MGKYFTGVQLLVAMISLTSCLETPSSKTPKVQMPSPEEIIESVRREYRTCDKKDSEQPQVSNEVLVNKIVIEDQIDLQKEQFVDCDGMEKGEPVVVPVRYHQSLVSIGAPPEGAFVGDLNFVSVENHRTCETVKMSVGKSEDFEQTEALYKKINSPVLKFADETGRVLVGIEESTMKRYGSSLPVHEGNNVLTVRYFGKCLEYNKVLKDGQKDDVNCAKAEELGSKKVFLELHVIRPLLDGVRKIDFCDKK